MDNETYLNPKDASELFNVTVRTLFNWEKTGKIKCIRTDGNHRRYLLSSFPKIKNISSSRRKICYCRVSTKSQQSDLERQVQFFKNKYPDYEIVRDVGSGLNFKRKGLQAILDSAEKGDVEEIVVTHPDRLCRFGFELIERIVQKYNGKIVVLDKEKTSPEQELVNDLISIVTVFSSRLYGLRSKSFKNKIKEQAQLKTDRSIKNDEVQIVSDRKSKS
jgi:putative resolvase